MEKPSLFLKKGTPASQPERTGKLTDRGEDWIKTRDARFWGKKKGPFSTRSFIGGEGKKTARSKKKICRRGGGGRLLFPREDVFRPVGGRVTWEKKKESRGLGLKEYNYAAFRRPSLSRGT